MSLLERIRTDQSVAERHRDKAGCAILSQVIAECRAKQSTRALTDGEVVHVLRKLIQTANPKASNLLQHYMPRPLTDDELTEIVVRQHRILNTITQIATYLKVNYAGRYDNRNITEFIRDLIT